MHIAARQLSQNSKVLVPSKPDRPRPWDSRAGHEGFDQPRDVVPWCESGSRKSTGIFTALGTV